MIDPELEVAGSLVGIAAECGLWLLLLQLIQDLPVRNVAHLVVLFDHQAPLVAHSTLTVRHHGIAPLIGGAYIAVDPLPAFFTIAIRALSW